MDGKSIIRKPTASKTQLRSICRCGCGEKALYLCSGQDYGGEYYVDEPTCFDATLYLEESAATLSLAFSKRPVSHAS